MRNRNRRRALPAARLGKSWEELGRDIQRVLQHRARLEASDACANCNAGDRDFQDGITLTAPASIRGSPSPPRRPALQRFYRVTKRRIFDRLHFVALVVVFVDDSDPA
jgi:hypothetical protein